MTSSPLAQPDPDPCLACVVLFDIDGTLITGPDAGPSPGVMAMNASAHTLTGLRDGYRLVEFAGRTDRQIARDLLRVGGKDQADSLIDELIALYTQGLERGVVQRPYRALGDARAAVLSLREAGATVGLGTGNVVRGAKAKLRSAGLADLFDFDLGGYGDDAEVRHEMLRCAAKRCDPSGQLPVVVVGDTPHDVLGARAIGARCIGVPTGSYSAQRLRDSGAEAIIEHLDATVVEVVRSLV